MSVLLRMLLDLLLRFVRTLDLPLLGALLALMGVGLATLYSASNESMRVVLTQGVYFSVGLGALGLGQPGWLIDGRLAMAVIIFVGLWIHVGFYTLIMLSGLQGIDPSVYEAAAIDGASPTQQFFSMTWPLLRPTTLVVVILATISGFQSFDFIWTLTGGGPVGATTLMVQYIYERAFQSPIRYGLASAGGVILFICVFGFTLLNYLNGRRQEAA